jgi:hypothetical protein
MNSPCTWQYVIIAWNDEYEQMLPQINPNISSTNGSI